MTAPVRRSAGLVFCTALLVSTAFVQGASAGAPASGVPLGAAASYAVLAGETVTNTGPSTVNGDVGTSPGSAVTGFPPGLVSNGSIHTADAEALAAQAALGTAYADAAGRSTTELITANLGGQTLLPGVYTGGAVELTGTLTLDAQGDSGAVFVFQASSSLVTASSSTVSLINGAGACNVFWQVGSSATLGSGSTMVGTVMALTSIFAATDASIQGRLLARTGEVTLDSNTFTRATCAEVVDTTTSTGGAGGGGSDTTAASSGGALPSTGDSFGGQLPAALVLTLIGTALVAFTRRSPRAGAR